MRIQKSLHAIELLLLNNLKNNNKINRTRFKDNKVQNRKRKIVFKTFKMLLTNIKTQRIRMLIKNKTIFLYWRTPQMKMLINKKKHR